MDIGLRPAAPVTADRPDAWAAYLLPDFPFTEFPTGARVLDVGFGEGDQLRRLRDAGCRVVGLEPDPALARRVRREGYAVCRGTAERLPFRAAAFDGVLCKVVLPYTDERRAIGELARVLRPGGCARLACHGLGYPLRYLFSAASWKQRVYGARTIANTLVYALLGRRLPGFLGDSLYQSRRRLQASYRQAGLMLIEDPEAPRFLGAPVFIYHTVRKAPSAEHPVGASPTPSSRQESDARGTRAGSRRRFYLAAPIVWRSAPG
ncbi:MAG TPA: class I SAM-dependent methyltransferase [Vicinamibacterales bacterium]|nr:class I SAM-dependent methyltransferase [Vicinamibacterales bacterium]